MGYMKPASEASVEEKSLFRMIGCAWIIGAITSLGIAAAVIWAIVRLVEKYG